MQDSDDFYLDNGDPHSPDELAQLAQSIEYAIEREEYFTAAAIVEKHLAATWFAFHPARTAEILEVLAHEVGDATPLVTAAYKVLSANNAGHTNTQALRDTIDHDDPQQMFVLSMFRMNDYRVHGMIHRALEQADTIESYLAQMRPSLTPGGGWLMQAPVQIGITAMLAGDFPRALNTLAQAQLRPANAKFVFLERESLVKAALIHAAFGNATTASGLLTRAAQVPRTSSWVEKHIDVQAEFASILSSQADPEEVIDQLEVISLHDIGEMWPFYVIALHRLLEAAGHHDELEHRLEMLDALPLPKIDGEGFSGSVIPLKRALTALSVGRGAEAVEFLQRADHSLTYTKLVRAATDLYVGRLHHAVDLAHALQRHTRGFRLLELRRLSILAAAHFMLDHTKEAIATLRMAAQMPRGLSPQERLLFGLEIHEFAERYVEAWPKVPAAHAIFLSELPRKGHSLTEREIEILEQLAQGLTRAQIAEQLFISLSTVKTQLQSIYRKLEVSSAADAIFEGERRGII